MITQPQATLYLAAAVVIGAFLIAFPTYRLSPEEHAKADIRYCTYVLRQLVDGQPERSPGMIYGCMLQLRAR